MLYIYIFVNVKIYALASNFYLSHLCSNITENTSSVDLCMLVHACDRIPCDSIKLVNMGRIACGLDGAIDNLSTGSNLMNLRSI